MLKFIFPLLAVGISVPILLSILRTDVSTLAQAQEATVISADKTIPQPPQNLVYESWSFENPADYGGWVVSGANSNVALGSLNMTFPSRPVSPIRLSLPNHQFNMYTNATFKSIFLTLSVRNPNTITPSSFSNQSSQRVKLTYFRSDTNQNAVRYFNVLANGQSQYFNIQIAEEPAVVISNVVFEFMNPKPNSVIKIEDIQVMDNYSGG